MSSGSARNHGSFHDFSPASNDEAIVRRAVAFLLEQNDVYGPPLTCKGIRVEMTDPVLAVVCPAWICSRTAAGPDGFCGSAARQNGRALFARIVEETFAEPGSAACLAGSPESPPSDGEAGSGRPVKGLRRLSLMRLSIGKVADFAVIRQLRELQCHGSFQ
jgi:hypothetical protein